MAEAGWGKAPILLRIIIISCLVSFVVLIIGYSTPLWFSYSGGIPINLYGLGGISTGRIYVDHLGLWHACGGGHGCIGITVNIPAYLGATRAFETMGLIAMVFTLVCIVLFVWIPSFAGNNRIEVAIMISSFVSSGLIIIGVIIFGAEFRYFLNFSFALCCISGILNALTGVMVILFKLKR